MTDATLPTTSAMLEKTPFWLSFSGKAAPISSIILYMAPIPTVLEFTRRKMVGNLPLLPYTSMLSNSLAWTVYGLMNSEPKLWTSNFVGFTLSIYYFFSFARYTPHGATTLPGTFDQHVQGFVSVLAFILWFARSKKSGPIGRVGVLINMAMYASPLSAIKAVLETKSSEAIPLPLTVASLASCIFWTITGYLDMHDPYVWVPTTFGIIFGMAQVALKLSFPEKAGVVMKDLSPELNSTQLAVNVSNALLMQSTPDDDLPGFS